MSQRSCWKCHKELNLPDGPLSFRAICDHCSSWIHCCLGCQNYAPGRSNDCLIPDTDPIFDREQANLCEEFIFLQTSSPQHRSISDAESELFGEELKESKNKDPKDRFDDLFD